MKKLIYIILLLMAVPVFNSCEKHDLDFYSGEDAIYFDQQWGLNWYDSLHLARQNYSLVEFGNMESVDSVVSIKIAIMGNIYDYDRPFSVEIVPDSTTAIEGEEYEILNPNLVILAGQNSTRLHVLIHKTDRLAEVNAQLQLRLVPGEHFVIPFDTEKGIGEMPLRVNGSTLYTDYGMNYDASIHNIFFNDFLVKPERWNEIKLGTYSEKKFRIALDLVEPLGWNVATFNSAKMWDNFGYNTVINLMARYLLEQYNKGREYWVIDPDGTMMWVESDILLWRDDTNPDEMVDV